MAEAQQGKSREGQSAINSILERTCRSQKLVWELGERLLLLEDGKSKEELKKFLGKRSPAEAAADLQKNARHVGEDLLEDQLRLDNVSGLSDADRTARKKALELIDRLLDEVDKAKVKLSAIAVEAKADPPAAEPETASAEGTGKTDLKEADMTPAAETEVVVKKVPKAKGTKRKSQDIDPIQQRCDKLAGAIRDATSLPMDMIDMLTGIIPQCLGVPQEKRHRFQNQTIEALDRLVQKTEQSLIQLIEDSKKKSAELKAQALPYEETVAEAHNKLDECTRRSQLEMRKLADITMRFRAARKELEQAQQSQQIGDKDYAAALRERQNLQAVVDNFIVPLKAGTVPAEDLQSQCDSLLSTMQQLDASLDESILRVLRSAFNKEPASRGDFEKMAIEQLVGTMTKHIELESETLKTGEEGKRQRAEVVSRHQEAFDAVTAEQKEQSQIFEASWQDKEQSVKALASAKLAVKDLASQVKESIKAVDQSEADSQVFHDYARAVFDELRNRTAPADQHPMETDVQQPAVCGSPCPQDSIMHTVVSAC